MPDITTEQMFAALRDSQIHRETWVETFGIDEHQIDFEIDDNFIDWLEKLGVFDDIDLADLWYRWYWNIELRASLSDFGDFLQNGIPRSELTTERWEQEVRPSLTFRRLAEWMAERIGPPSFAPMNIAGRNCGPAGAFLGIAETVAVVSPGPEFPPRSPILNRLRGKDLKRVWERLTRYTADHLPNLVFPYKKYGDAVLFAALLLGWIVIMTAPLARFWAIPLIAACAWLGRWGIRLGRSGDPLPPHIKTFRDLALVMSETINGLEPTRTTSTHARRD